MTSSLPKLATALETIATFAPPGYTNWASIATDGASAAKNGDLTAAKAACRSCHEQYKQKYKAELRARKI
jgi:cytochrome c553